MNEDYRKDMEHYAELWVKIGMPKLLQTRTAASIDQTTDGKQHSTTQMAKPPDPASLRGSGIIDAKHNDDGKTRKQAYSLNPNAKGSRLKTTQRAPHNKIGKLAVILHNPFKKQINDIPIHQYANWAKHYTLTRGDNK